MSGKYGNGFKSGSMRLGKDAMVFTKHKTTKSCGMLSQTFLESIGANEVLIPMLSWPIDDAGHSTAQLGADDGGAPSEAARQQNLRTIIENSPFQSEDALLSAFEQIKSSTGTAIYIFNLRREEDGQYELDFTKPDDIRLSTTGSFCSAYLSPG
eukprot:SAG31_NODE_1937_length_6866_cov_3.173932_7_plen_154_part_00